MEINIHNYHGVASSRDHDPNGPYHRFQYPTDVAPSLASPDAQRTASTASTASTMTLSPRPSRSSTATSISGLNESLATDIAECSEREWIPSAVFKILKSCYDSDTSQTDWGYDRNQLESRLKCPILAWIEQEHPELLNDEQHRSGHVRCAQGFDDPRRVKDHLKSVHLMKYHSKGYVISVDLDDGLGPRLEEMRSTAPRKKPSESSSDHWCKIWETLFPGLGGQRRPSPYQPISTFEYAINQAKNTVIPHCVQEYSNSPLASGGASVKQVHEFFEKIFDNLVDHFYYNWDPRDPAAERKMREIVSSNNFIPNNLLEDFARVTPLRTNMSGYPPLAPRPTLNTTHTPTLMPPALENGPWQGQAHPAQYAQTHSPPNTQPWMPSPRVAVDQSHSDMGMVNPGQPLYNCTHHMGAGNYLHTSNTLESQIPAPPGPPYESQHFVPNGQPHLPNTDANSWLPTNEIGAQGDITQAGSSFNVPLSLDDFSGPDVRLGPPADDEMNFGSDNYLSQPTSQYGLQFGQYSQAGLQDTGSDQQAHYPCDTPEMNYGQHGSGGMGHTPMSDYSAPMDGSPVSYPLFQHRDPPPAYQGHDQGPWIQRG